MSRHTLLLEVAYDGNAFHGVARQPGLPTVSETLERHLNSVLGASPRALTFAARTDRGVSAKQNFATCWFRGPDLAEARVERVCGELPALRVVQARWVPRHVNARNSTCDKHYRYVIETASDRSEAQRGRPTSALDAHAWPVWKIVPRLNVQAMQQAARALEGEHDFSAFRAVSCDGKDPIKVLTRVSVEAHGDLVVIDVHGRAFLRKMMRILVGTLAEVGAALRPADSLPTLLTSRDRRLAGMTAPASGLCLMAVHLNDF